jgi:colanic acid/amylovoran biosynthesis protein
MLPEAQKESRRPMSIGLLGASFATCNLGVNALTVGAVQSALHCYPESEVLLFDYERSPATHRLAIEGREVEIPLVNLRFSKKFYLSNNIARLLLEAAVMKLIPSRALRERFIRKNPWLGRICHTDLFASLSAGDSFSDIYGLERLLYMALPQVLVLVAGKRLILLPQTLGPFQGRISKVIARYILRRAERVYSRDYRGADTVHALIGSKLADEKVAFCYDIGFAVDPIVPARLEIEGITFPRSDGSPLIGLNVSGLLAMGGYNRANMFGLRVNYRELVARLIIFLIEERHAIVLLVPHVFGEGPHSESDAAVCEEFYERLRGTHTGRVGLIRGTCNEREIKHVIGQCDFFVGSRMHACIAALSQNVPALAIAYSDKFIGVMETIGLESLVADPRQMGQDEILEKLSDIYDRRQTIRSELEHRIPKIKQRVLMLFDDISESVAMGNTTALKSIETSSAIQ